MKFSTLAAGAALAALATFPAAAAVTVLGDSSAQQCSDAAFHDHADATSIQFCSEAISNAVLPRRDLSGTYINRGVLYLDRGDFTNARADFDTAIKVDPEIGEAWVNRGAIDILDKRYKDGISDIDRGLSLGTQEPAKAYYNRGVAYEAIDDEKSAYLDYEQALTLEPNWDLPKQELLRFTVTRKDPGAGQ